MRSNDCSDTLLQGIYENFSPQYWKWDVILSEDVLLNYLTNVEFILNEIRRDVIFLNPLRNCESNIFAI